MATLPGPANLPAPESSKSFWHSEPSEFLLGHRTTTDLPTEADIVIIGSGITGASIARFLSEDARAKDLSVVMLDAREACWCATGRNGGHCQPLLLKASSDVAAFEVRNVENVASYIQENDVSCEWRSLTACRTYWTKPLADQARWDVDKLKLISPDLGQKIDFIEGQDMLKQHRVETADCATLTVSAASLWPYKLVSFILEKAIRAGRLNLQTTTPVTAVADVDANNTWNRQSFRYTVTTPRGSIRARHVAFATNAYTSHLLPRFADLIVPERGVMSALVPPTGMQRLPNSYGFVGPMGNCEDHDDYLIQRPFAAVRRNDYLNQRPFGEEPDPQGHLMFGGGKVAASLESIGETDDTVVDPGCAAYLRRMLLEVMNLGGEADGLDELKATQQWSGIWGTSKDNHPWVGGIPDRPGLWLSAGYSGHGMPNATLCGKAVVEMILGDESGAPLEYVTERLVRTGNLPEGYLITPDRFIHSVTLDSVRQQDARAEKEAREYHESRQDKDIL